MADAHYGPVDQTLASEPPSLLAYYTTRGGLLGILKKREVWVSSIHFLNDSAEYRWAVEGAAGILDREFSALKDERKAELLQRFRSALGILRPIEPFAFCLSANVDQLSQWRGYAPRGGFCMVFNTRALIPGFLQSHFKLGRCEYAHPPDSQRLRTIMTEELKKIFDVLNSREADSEALGDIIEEHVDGLAFLIALEAPFIKHPGFEEEKEWRFVATVVDADTQVRDGPACLVPFLRVQLGD